MRAVSSSRAIARDATRDVTRAFIRRTSPRDSSRVAPSGRLSRAPTRRADRVASSVARVARAAATTARIRDARAGFAGGGAMAIRRARVAPASAPRARRGLATRTTVSRRAIVPDRDDGARARDETRGETRAGRAGRERGASEGERERERARREYRAYRARRTEVGNDARAREDASTSRGTAGADADAEAAARRGHAEALRAGDVDGAVKALATLARRGEGEARTTRAVVSKAMAKSLAKSHKGFMKQCVKTYRMDAALRYARLFDARDRDFARGKDLYCTVIYLCGREEGSNQWNIAREAFELRRDEAGLEPDPYAYSALVCAAGRCGKARTAREVFEEANAVNAVDAVVYNAYIDVCAHGGDYDGARATLERMKTTPNCAPNIRSYNGVISAATRKKHFPGAMWAWEEIKAANLQPTMITYGAMLAAGAAADDVDVRWSEDLFAQALESGACGNAGNDHMVTSMLQTYARGVALEQIDRDVAMERGERVVQALIEDAQWDERRAESTPNGRVWSALITLCARCGRAARAIEVLKIMISSRSHRVGHEWLHLTYALTSALEASKEGIEYFVRVQREIEQSPAMVRDCTGVRNGLIATHLHFGDFKSAFKVYDDFKNDIFKYRKAHEENWNARARRGLERQLPDTITYNSLIYACADDDVKAMGLYHDMVSNGINPTVRTYVALIVALSRSKRGSKVTEAEKLFKAAIDDGVTPNEFLFTALMDAQVKANRPLSAFETYARMIEADVNCTTVTFGCALQACCYVEDVEESVERAYSVLRDMTERDVQMNDWCSNTFLRVISRAGRIEEMLEEVKKTVRRKGKLEQETLEAIIRALCSAGYVERANRFISMMNSRNLEPSEHTFKEFIVASSRDGFVDWAWESYKRFTRLGHKLDASTRSALVAVLSVASTSPDPDDAELLLARAIGVFEAAFKRADEDDGPQVLDVIDAEARCALIVAMARSEKLDRALDIWRDSPKAQSFSKARKHTSSEGNDYIGDVRAMYECLIEVCCHEDRIDDALEVFDHLKDAGVRVSTVTLAFLESSCRRCRVEEWRMFDVCAQMRAQVEQKNEGRLAKPTKMSHHVRDDGDIASELATDGLGGEQKTSAWRKNVD